MTSGPGSARRVGRRCDSLQVAVCIHVRHSRKKWAMNRLRRRQEQGQQKGRVEIQGVERMKLPALHFCRTWEKDFLTMIGSQRRLSCKTGVLALAFSCSHVILVDFVCHRIDCLQSYMLCQRICASKDVGTEAHDQVMSSEYMIKS